MTGRYLIITEDSSTYIADEFEGSLFVNADDGILQIIDLENKTEYFNGEWVAITHWA